MMLVEETTVPDTDLPVDAFKAHLRLGTGFTPAHVQDAVLVSFLRAALAAVEARTGKALLRRQFSWSVSHWRSVSAAVVPIAPVAAIAQVEVVDRAGIAEPVAADAYWLEADSMRPRLCAVGSRLPAIPVGGSVVVQLQAGYGAVWDEVPADLRQAVMLLAAHYYEFRNETSLSAGCMPFGVSSLIARYAQMRLWSGEVAQ